MTFSSVKASIFGALFVVSANTFAQSGLPAEAAPPVEPAPADAQQIARDSTDPELSAKERDARSGIAVAARLSTLGFGVEVIKSVHKRVNLRAQGNFFDLDKSVEEDGVDYKGKLKLKTYGLLADFHPFAGSFRLTAGGYSNGNEVGLNAACKSECEVGDLKITDDANSSNDARVFGDIKFNSLAPYVGLGFGNAMRGWPVHFGVDVGVLLQGSPKVNLGAAGIARVTDENGNTTTENLATNQDVQNALKEEEVNAEDSSKEFKYYPVVNFTIGYRFKF